MDEQFMRLALMEAKKAQKNGDVPVGAVVVRNGKVLAKAYNKKELKQNPLFHAEMLAISKACKKVKNFRLDECTIYVTKEPCLMCMGGILSARMKHIVFGSYDKKFGNISLCQENNFNHKCTFIGGVLEQENNQLLSNFFSSLRTNKKQKGD